MRPTTTEAASRLRAVAPAVEEEPLPVGLTEDALALEFTRRHGAGLRYVHQWRDWLQETGHGWRPDQVLRVFDLARTVARDAASGMKPRSATRIASAQTVAGIVRLASTDPDHARTTDVWDRDPMLLNTPGGTVDLSTGQLRSYKSDDYLTKQTAVTPGGSCPLWVRFLDRVTGGDAELVAFLRRAFGYALTGHTREHALFFAIGTGGNGKGVTLNTITGVLGDYAVVANTDTFTVAVGDRHPTELAMLRAARFVAAQETEEGRRWNEPLIKALTGGDPITARFMRQDFFTFTPAFKLFLSGNHKPALRTVDEAMRRRLHLIPFQQTIPLAERDLGLGEKLKAEWPGILAWAVQGCLEWQASGLRPPTTVSTATDDYFATEDAVGRWLGECCTAAKGTETRSSELFASWKAWADGAGEYVGSQKRLSQQLLDRGFDKYHARDGWRFLGLGLLP